MNGFTKTKMNQRKMLNRDRKECVIMSEAVEKFCSEIGAKRQESHIGYPNCGTLYTCVNNMWNVHYWQYETDLFTVSIHDIFVREEIVQQFDWEDYPEYKKSICSSYIISAHGEILTPYKPFCDQMLLIWVNSGSDFRYCLHAGFPYRSVDFEFKQEFIRKYFEDLCGVYKENLFDVFAYSTIKVPKGLSKISEEIISLKKDPGIETLYLESKAKEWASIILEAYFEQKQKEPMNAHDKEGILNVANYINDHYSLEIKQDFLAQIAFMSPTKLRECFKKEFNMTITEYTQRKRISMAEVLLFTTDLPIREVARSVGYTSHSRFSSLYYKYMGMYPSDVRSNR